MTSWTFLVPEELEDQFVAELWSLGALGFESHPAVAAVVRLDAFFENPRSEPPAAWNLAIWRSRGVRDLGILDVPDQDWLELYRETATPFDVGQRFRIDPRDEKVIGAVPVNVEPAEATARFLLRIPARTAFGTGSHESTRLAIAWLEELDLRGSSVLDVGTGSGILAFVAERLGARRVLGFDVDPQAVCLAQAYARLNRAAPRFFAGRLAGLADRRPFDLALVNILPENIGSELPRLAGLLIGGGRVISSGNLLARRDELLAVWATHGFVSTGEKVDGEWAAWLLRHR